MTAQDWDARYGAGHTWGDAPNVWVAQHAADLRPGVALDLAAGDGRHARWLADRGWRVLATDFSLTAARRGRGRTADVPGVAWVVSDALRPVVAPGSVDLVVVAYLQLQAADLRVALRGAAAAVRPGGTLLVVSHDVTNLTAGVGGPQDAAVLTTPDAVAAAAGAEGLVARLAVVAERPVDGATRPARDTVVVAGRPSSHSG